MPLFKLESYLLCVEFSNSGTLSFGLIIFEQSCWKLNVPFYFIHFFFHFPCTYAHENIVVLFLCGLNFQVSLQIVLLPCFPEHKT